MPNVAENHGHGRYHPLVSYQPPFDWSAWDLNSVIERDHPPTSVRIAVRFMLAGAAIEAVVLILELLAFGSILRRVVYPAQITPGQLHLAEDVAWGYLIVIGLAEIGIWLWMAAKNNAGRRWARLVSTGFFAFYSLDVAYFIARGVPGGDGQLLFPVALWLVGLGATVLLWQRESSEFIAARARHYY
jgi:hypothetical protein